MKILYVILVHLLLASPSFASDKIGALKFEEYKGFTVPDDIPIFDEKNEKHYFEEYDGVTLLVVFWASWCAPCAQEMMDLDLLQKDFRKLPFRVIAISEDYAGAKAALDFYQRNYIRHLSVFYDYRNALFNGFKVVGMPTSFIINADGMNVAEFKGVVNWHDEEVRSILLRYIPGNPTEPKNTYKQKTLNQLNPTNKTQSPSEEVKDDKKE